MERNEIQSVSGDRRGFDARLAAYLAATAAAGAGMSTEAHAGIIANNTVQPFGVNGEVRMDFNSDGQTDFSIDHDRVAIPSGPTVDYLQIDKNDINGEGNPLAFDPGPGSTFQATPFQDGATTRNDANESAYVITGPQGSYPAALTLGTPIGPASAFDWQETDNFQGGGKDIRANRLIDEDATQIDQMMGGQPASGVQVPGGTPGWVGLGGQTRYVGLKMDLNNGNAINYGWVGVRITNEANGTGEVVGFGYETTPNLPIAAGVPEPGSFATICIIGGALLSGRFLRKRMLSR